MISEEFVKKLLEEYEKTVYPKAYHIAGGMNNKAKEFYSHNKSKRNDKIPFAAQLVKTIEGRDWYVNGFANNYKSFKADGVAFCIFCMWKDDAGEVNVALTYESKWVEIYRPSFFAEYKSKMHLDQEDSDLIKHYFDENDGRRIRNRELKDNTPSTCYIPEGCLVGTYYDSCVFEVTGFNLLGDSDIDYLLQISEELGVE